jgi:NADP-dependent 3-hydroxy acid dehydrogenase YdfG
MTSTGTRSAIVTGGASGIGRALAEALAATGVGVVLADRQADLAEQGAAAIAARGGSATAAELDVRDVDRFRHVVQDTVARAGRLDYLFNNAGIGLGGEAHEFGPADWDDVIDVNLRGVSHGILAAYPVMMRQRFGHIVNTASMAGLTPGPTMISYTATKYAVDPAFIAEAFERLRPMEPAALARRVLRAVDQNRAIIIEPWWYRIGWYVDRLSPALFERVAAWLLRRTQRASDAHRQRQGTPGS